jgi:group II intron reverse transcriptase/maturase
LAVARLLTAIYEQDFLRCRDGYRPNVGALDAVDTRTIKVQFGRYHGVVEADITGFFGSVDHEKRMTLVARKSADGRVLRLIESILKAGGFAAGHLVPTQAGTPRGGVASPLLSNMLLTPFDREMRARGYRLTRSAADWVVTCRTRADAERVLAAAQKILEQLGVRLNPEKTRIGHVRYGFGFLGYTITRGSRPLRLDAARITRGARSGARYAYPAEQAIPRFKDRVRQITKRRVPLSTAESSGELTPSLRGWGLSDCKAHVRRLCNRLHRWIVHRLWSHRFRRWRKGGWRELPERCLYGALGLVKLRSLIPAPAS